MVVGTLTCALLHSMSDLKNHTDECARYSNLGTYASHNPVWLVNFTKVPHVTKILQKNFDSPSYILTDSKDNPSKIEFSRYLIRLMNSTLNIIEKTFENYKPSSHQKHILNNSEHNKKNKTTLTG